MGPKGLVSHGRNGFVCNDEKDFRNRIDLLVSNAELRLKMGREARSFALSQSWDNVFFQLFQIYAQVLEQADARTLMDAERSGLKQGWEVT
jgi:glycosyltransferase involved in cell wall biosynthesis